MLYQAIERKNSMKKVQLMLSQASWAFNVIVFSSSSGASMQPKPKTERTRDIFSKKVTSTQPHFFITAYSRQKGQLWLFCNSLSF